MTIAELMERFPARVRAAFLAGVQEIRDKARIGEITRALERGDVNAALEALYIERAAWAQFEAELEAAFGDGGVSQIDELGRIEDLQGNRLVFRFTARALRAERILRDYSSQRVTAIVEDQRQAVRNALDEGLQRGDNPRRTALEIVGRVDRRTGARSGGILGLSVPQERAVSGARAELERGDYTSYRNRERRDRRFDATIARAQREERPLTRQEIERLTSRYSDRLLALRGEVIGRTETLSALNLGRYEAIEQLIETGNVRRQDVKLVWKATKDPRTRDSHAVLDGESVAFGEAFTTINGARLRYPGDPQGGAAEVINCRCSMKTRIDRRSNG